MVVVVVVVVVVAAEVVATAVTTTVIDTNTPTLMECSTRVQNTTHSSQCFHPGNESKNNILLYNFYNFTFHTYFIVKLKL